MSLRPATLLLVAGVVIAKPTAAVAQNGWAVPDRGQWGNNAVVVGQPIPGSERIISTRVVSTSRPVDSSMTPRAPTVPTPPVIASRPTVASRPVWPQPREKSEIRERPGPWPGGLRPSAGLIEASALRPIEPPIQTVAIERPMSWSEQLRRAESALEEFRRTAGQNGSPVRDVAERNVDLITEWLIAHRELGDLIDQVDTAEDKLRRTEDDFRDTQAKLEQYGLTTTVGLLLRHKKEQLQRWRASTQANTLADRDLAAVRERRLALEMTNEDGSEPRDQAVARLVAAGVDPDSWQGRRDLAVLEAMLRRRYEWIAATSDRYTRQTEEIGRLDTARQATAKLGDDYSRFIERQILWIRSNDAISLRTFTDLPKAADALFSPARSEAIGVTIGRKWAAARGETMGLALLIVIILLVRWRAKSAMQAIGLGKTMRDRTPAARTGTAAALTAAVAAGLPAILYAISRWLDSGIVSEATLHASSGAAAAALVAWVVELPRQSLRNGGLADSHLGFELPRRRRAYHFIAIIGAGLMVAAYVVTIGKGVDAGAWRGSLPRVGFMLAMLLAAWTFHRTLKPAGGFAEPLIAKFGGRVVHRLRLLLYLTGIGVPAGLIGLAGLGFGYTATELLRRVMLTWIAGGTAALLWPGVSTACSHGWRLLTSTHPDDDLAVSGHLASHFLELKHQFAFLAQCSLIVAGLGAAAWLWVDALPVAGLGNPVLWTVGQDADAQNVTAMHLAIAAGTLFIAFQLAKLLPALFDALVLQRVSFDEAMEHVLFLGSRCVIFGVGLLVASRLVGLRWAMIQWLAVGLTIGIGFGLQDLIRNLVGGLVVLFEKPAALGDRISVGKLTGRVLMQRLRTTTLTDDEGREVIVPNKAFIAGEVVNHMGAGRLTAVTFEVSVHRDERAADVCRTLTELMIEQPDVLLSPAPQATLVCVAQRSQRIELRAWIESSRDADRMRRDLSQITRKNLRDAGLLVRDPPARAA